MPKPTSNLPVTAFPQVARAIITRLEHILKTGGEMIEFWYDPDAKVFFIGEEMGDTLADALFNFVTKGDHA